MRFDAPTVRHAAGDPPRSSAFPGALHGPGSTRSAARPARILVVDDEIDIREALEWTLRRASYEVVSAESGMAAVAAARRGRFDLVLTDYRMPGMTGAETIGALKQLDPSIRVIVATGYFSEETAAECRARGADEYIKKPFDLDELLGMVERLLA